jgi:hypothetical protein
LGLHLKTTAASEVKRWRAYRMVIVIVVISELLAALCVASL